MIYLAVVFAFLVICFLIVKLAKYVATINMVLVAITIISMLITPINLKIGVYVAVWSVLLMFILWVLFALSGFITLVIVTPVLLLLGAVGLLKK